MKVSPVNLCGNEFANVAYDSYTPEELAALGARYSRSDLGYDKLSSQYRTLKEECEGQSDRSIDRIFNFIDYGHASIGDMAPIAMFIDDVSMWLAYYVFSICPTASGQESSTRYLKLDRNRVIDKSLLSFDANVYERFIDLSFEAYECALEFWGEIAKSQPGLTSDRLRRNFAFDRARYFLPFSTLTNMMLVLSGRDWAKLCRTLRSHYLPEAVQLGDTIAVHLGMVAPRFSRHATADDLWVKHHRDYFVELGNLPHAYEGNEAYRSREYLQIFDYWSKGDFVSSLANHTHRYSPFGDRLRVAPLVFTITGITLAELRDLNRHRPGEKFSSLLPRGFYGALDQLPDGVSGDRLRKYSQMMNLHLSSLLPVTCGDYYYLMPLGAQVDYQHSTHAAHFLYMAQLRTGAGTHYRYRQHFMSLMDKWFEYFPETRSLIQLGDGEPE